MPVNPPIMQAIIQDGYGKPELVLRPGEIEVPSIGAGDVLIRVRATSVNTPDWATVAGVPYILRPGVGLRLHRARCPRMELHDAARGERQLAQRRLPVGALGADRDLADHGIGHAV